MPCLNLTDNTAVACVQHKVLSVYNPRNINYTLSSTEYGEMRPPGHTAWYCHTKAEAEELEEKSGSYNPETTLTTVYLAEYFIRDSHSVKLILAVQVALISILIFSV